MNVVRLNVVAPSFSYFYLSLFTFCCHLRLGRPTKKSQNYFFKEALPFAGIGAAIQQNSYEQWGSLSQIGVNILAHLFEDSAPL
jgi:hypothetical protein